MAASLPKAISLTSKGKRPRCRVRQRARAEGVRDGQEPLGLKKLRSFRAGVEGIISLLKRGFGLDRCTWRTLPSFKSYVWGSVIASDLLVVVRHVLA